MTNDNIRYYLEQSYETARKMFQLLSGKDWQKYAANFPPANTLTFNDLAGLATDLNQIVQVKMQEIEKKQEQTISELLVDSITNLSTRNHFAKTIEELTLEQLEEQSLTLIIIDVNRLKHLNDTHGHSAGNEYLATLGEAINSSLHRRDQAFRIGGDEILIIPYISAQDATELVKKDPLLSNATIPEIMLKAADIIAKRILSKFQKLWDNKFDMKSGFSHGAATLFEPTVQHQISHEKTKKSMEAKEIINIIFKEADKRQYAHKEQLKKTGQYYNMSIIPESPTQPEGTVVAK